MELEKQIIIYIKQLRIKDDIEMVILFGSQARGDSNDNSDIDIAFKLDNKSINVINTLELRSDLISYFSSKLGKECDIVFINQAPSLLKYQIVKHGKPVYIADNFDYNSFFSLVIKEYFDFKYYQDFHYRLMLNRIKKGGKKNG